MLEEWKCQLVDESGFTRYSRRGTRRFCRLEFWEFGRSHFDGHTHEATLTETLFFVAKSDMLTRYLKRVRMEIDFRRTVLDRPALPDGFRWRAWEPQLLQEHASVKFKSFHREMDSHMFASLASYGGCEELMRGIAKHSGFLAAATWLIEYHGSGQLAPVSCGTIQGLTCSTTQGSIQNVGVIPEYRGLGLGRALVLKSLTGFRRDGMLRVHLDVTAENTPAVDLYQSIGFRSISTSFRELATPIDID